MPRRKNLKYLMKALAKKLGADNYGMKMYVLVILKSGSNTTETKAKTDSLFAGHMANMGKMVEMQKLVVAGPLGKNDKNYRGIFILNTKSIEEAKQLLESDPAIKAKLLEPELYNWYGSAALSEYLPFHDKIQKSSF
ncbi:YciI family protein [Pedobacter miscanthi]|nr:YciI family protein [Pedobacter miscanthi]